MYFAETFTAAVNGKRQETFHCARCGFVAPVEICVFAEGKGEAPFGIGMEAAQRKAADRAVGAANRTARRYLNVFACPQCRRSRTRVGLALRCLGWFAVLLLPVTLLAFMFLFIGATQLGIGEARIGTTAPFVLTGIIVAVTLPGLTAWRWRKAHRDAEKNVKLRRFWEWQIPSGPRIVAVQDPGSGDDAVWIDGVRAAKNATEEGYVVPLARATEGDPYRVIATQAKLVFPSDGTCSLTLGGKRIEPVQTSSDVL